MPIPTYIPITDAQIAPEAPMTSPLMTQLRDNMVSVVQGGPGAPRMGSGLLSIGGGELDGLVSGSPALANPGLYDFDGGQIAANITSAPGYLWIRVLGDLDLNAKTLTFTRPVAMTDTMLKAFSAVVGASGVTGTGGSASGSGGAGYGAGGAGTGGNVGGTGGGPPNPTNRFWAAKRPIIGGIAGNGTAAAGAGLILMVDGNILATGATISCVGGAGAVVSGTNIRGGAGGGSIIICCSGTITDGTFTAVGGNGANNGGTQSGSGGGGYIALIAQAFAGVQTTHVTAGTGGSPGADGLAEIATMTSNFINSMIWR